MRRDDVTCPLNLEGMRIIQAFTLCIILATEASEKKDNNNNLKQPFNPLFYPSNICTRPNLGQISGEEDQDPRFPSESLPVSSENAIHCFAKTNVREKGRDLTYSYDKSSYTDRKIQKAM